MFASMYWIAVQYVVPSWWQSFSACVALAPQLLSA